MLYLVCAPLAWATGEAHAKQKRPWRILHVMSYDTDSIWSNEQFAGFKQGFGNDEWVEYKVVELNTKRNSSPNHVADRVKQAEQLIRVWKPDLLYVSDDVAIEHMLRHHADTALPIVFSGLNRSLAHYKVQHARNITGVQERIHFVESIRLLQEIKPGIRRIHVVSDTADFWTEPLQRIREQAWGKTDFELVGVDTVLKYRDFQRILSTNPQRADAFVLLGMHSYKDDAGHDTPFATLQEWIAHHSHTPDLSFWAERISAGTLAGITLSGLEQGAQAGQRARRILLDKAPPASLPVEATHKSVAAINLQRAKALGLMPRSTVLLSAQVFTRYDWTRRP